MGTSPTPKALKCPSCGGALPRGRLDPESPGAACPWCGYRIDLGTAGVARGSIPDDAPPTCLHCGASFEDAAFERLLRLVTCASCGSVFDLTAGRYALWYRRRLEEKAGTPLPRDFRVTDSLGNVTLEFHGGMYGAAIHFLPLALPMVLVGILALLADRVPRWLLWGTCGGGAILAFLTMGPFLCNRWRVTVRGGRLHRASGPVPDPFRRRREIPAGEIRQLFVEYLWIDRGDDGRTGGRKRQEKPGYALRILRTDGSRETFVGPFEDLGKALFLEEWIERRLRIEDRHVDGERNLPPV